MKLNFIDVSTISHNIYLVKFRQLRKHDYFTYFSFVILHNLNIHMLGI